MCYQVRQRNVKQGKDNKRQTRCPCIDNQDLGRKRGQIFADAGMHGSGAEGLRQNKATVVKYDATRPITVIRWREHLDFISIKSVYIGSRLSD